MLNQLIKLISQYPSISVNHPSTVSHHGMNLLLHPLKVGKVCNLVDIQSILRHQTRHHYQNLGFLYILVHIVSIAYHVILMLIVIFRSLHHHKLNRRV